MSDSELISKGCPNPGCEFDKHHPKANFCVLCGTLLFRRCENCLDINPRYANFCQFCGSNLDEVREAFGAQPAPESKPLVQEPPAEEPEKKHES